MNLKFQEIVFKKFCDVCTQFPGFGETNIWNIFFELESDENQTLQLCQNLFSLEKATARVD